MCSSHQYKQQASFDTGKAVPGGTTSHGVDHEDRKRAEDCVNTESWLIVDELTNDHCLNSLHE